MQTLAFWRLYDLDKALSVHTRSTGVCYSILQTLTLNRDEYIHLVEITAIVKIHPNDQKINIPWRFDFHRKSSSEEWNINCSSTGQILRWSTGNRIDPWDGLKRPYTSARKDNEQWSAKKAATSSATRTTVFLAHLLLTVPRTGRRIDIHSSDEDFRWKSKRQRYFNFLVVLDEF